MKNKLIIIGLILGSLVIIFFSAWFSVYSSTKSYYEDAIESYENENYGLALKGKHDNYTTDFTGGFQQVVSAWSGVSSIFVPSFVDDSLEYIDTIINEDVTIEDIDDIFATYFTVDNMYLGDLLFRKAEIYVENGLITEAIDLLYEIKEIFPLDTALNEKIDKYLDELEG